MPTQLDPVRVAYINMGNHLYFNRIIKKKIKSSSFTHVKLD